MPMTLEDVAKISGVSRSTVSRVINGDPNVSERTRTRVLGVIQELNFQPNLAARSLAAGHTRVLSLIMPTAVANIFTDPYFPLVIQGFSSACNARDYSVMLWLAEPEYERRMVRQIMHNGLVDGVTVSSAMVNDPIVDALIEAKMPMVMIGRLPNNPNGNYVDTDNFQGGRQATLHLLRLGHRRIATITGPLNMVVGVDRLRGYKAALQERGVPFRQEMVVEGDFSEMGGYSGMMRLLPLRPDAVFIASDVMAMGAQRAILETGFRIPEDIALVGFDDIPASARGNLQLTTIRQPISRLGVVAAETLIDIIEHPESQPRHIILSTELVIRTSCGTIST
jgi:LacI family transcriptional regulator